VSGTPHSSEGRGPAHDRPGSPGEWWYVAKVAAGCIGLVVALYAVCFWVAS